MKRIIIGLNAAEPRRCRWARQEADGALTTGAGSLAEAAAQVEGHRLQVLVPGEEVLLTRVELPPGNRKQLLAAIPYALEESLAAEIEDQHFARGAGVEQGRPAVAVIARERLEFWLDLLREEGLEPAFMTPETLALPWTPGRRTLVLAGGRALVRSGEQEGYTLENDSLAFLETAGAPDFEIYRQDSDTKLPVELVAQVTVEEPAPDPAALWAVGLEEKKAVNLLQGTYSPNAHWEKYWRQWRLPALLLLALIMVGGIGTLLEFFQLRAYDLHLRAEVEEVYRRTFPAAQRVVNPRAQMEHQLQTLRGDASDYAGPDFLALLDRATPTLAAGGLHIRGLRYRAGELDLEIEIADLQGLDGLKEELERQGLAVEIRTATSRDAVVQARLQVKEGG